MKITKEQKDIIWLIEPYMNKQFCKWCLFIDTTSAIEWDILEVISDINEIDFNEKIIWLDFYTLSSSKSISTPASFYLAWYKDQTKILWHYTMDAVEKYISLNWYYIEIWWYFNSEVVILISKEKDWEVLFELPHKPLHLYTAEENKKLLIILQKILK